MNVIWIVSDTFRRDHIGAYGNKIIRTPSLDALASKSVRFDRHYAAGFPTMPARADYMTGRWTTAFIGWEPLPASEVTIAQILADRGFHTAAVVDTPFYLRGGMGYDRGFRSFIEVPGQGILEPMGRDVRVAWRFESDRFAPQTFIKAMHWLELHHKEDFFLFVDVWDPHDPWDAPKYYTELYWPGYDGEIIQPNYGYIHDTPGLTEDKVKKARATYCGEITMVDTWVGYFLRQLENLDLLEKTAIIFTSDHGFHFGEHGGLFGKMCRAKRPDGTLYRPGEPGSAWAYSPLYEEIVAIPLFIYVPDTMPAVCSGLTSAIDLMPTALDIVGQIIPPQVEGRSLLPMMRNSSRAGREYVVSMAPFKNPGDRDRLVHGLSTLMQNYSAATVTTDEWSLLYAVEPGLSELYHLVSDPGQKKNIIAERPEVARELHKLLIQLMHETNVPERFLEPRLKLQL